MKAAGPKKLSSEQIVNELKAILADYLKQIDDPESREYQIQRMGSFLRTQNVKTLNLASDLREYSKGDTLQKVLVGIGLALRQAHCVKELDLSSNDMTDHHQFDDQAETQRITNALQAFAQSLKGVHLDSLDLSRNSLRLHGLLAFSQNNQGQIKYLNFSNNRVGNQNDPDPAIFAQPLQGVLDLDLSHNMMSNAEPTGVLFQIMNWARDSRLKVLGIVRNLPWVQAPKYFQTLPVSPYAIAVDSNVPKAVIDSLEARRVEPRNAYLIGSKAAEYDGLSAQIANKISSYLPADLGQDFMIGYRKKSKAVGKAEVSAKGEASAPAEASAVAEKPAITPALRRAPLAALDVQAIKQIITQIRAEQKKKPH
jgi:hypothetical protein